jgi:hypothetical protein
MLLWGDDEEGQSTMQRMFKKASQEGLQSLLHQRPLYYLNNIHPLQTSEEMEDLVPNCPKCGAKLELCDLGTPIAKILRSRSKTNTCAPTLKEVTDYIKERGSNVDAEAFCAYYDSVGWKVGRNPMKSWKSAVITWEKRMEPVVKGEDICSFEGCEYKAKGESRSGRRYCSAHLPIY